MRIAVFGCGYVGLTTAVGLAELGNDVMAVDIDPAKIASLKKGVVPFYEPKMEPLLQCNITAGRLNFLTDGLAAILESEVVFCTVGTPADAKGEIDLRAVYQVAVWFAEVVIDDLTTDGQGFENQIGLLEAKIDTKKVSSLAGTLGAHKLKSQNSYLEPKTERKSVPGHILRKQDGLVKANVPHQSLPGQRSRIQKIFINKSTVPVGENQKIYDFILNKINCELIDSQKGRHIGLPSDEPAGNIFNNCKKNESAIKSVLTGSQASRRLNTATASLQNQTRPALFHYIYNPEFLREGSALEDFFNPDRIIAGVVKTAGADRAIVMPAAPASTDMPARSASPDMLSSAPYAANYSRTSPKRASSSLKSESAARKIIEKIYKPMTIKGIPLLFTDLASAEIIKYASNAFLATKISFINQIADFCVKIAERTAVTDANNVPVEARSAQAAEWKLSRCITTNAKDRANDTNVNGMADHGEVCPCDINTIANGRAEFGELVPCDINTIARGIGLDHRIGPDFLQAGIGFGGSCLPKDLKAMISAGEKIGLDLSLLKAVDKINENRPRQLVNLLKRELTSAIRQKTTDNPFRTSTAKIKINEKLANLKNKKIAIWGAAFKPNTDDLRDAPALKVIKILLKEKAKIAIYDPAALPNLRKIFDKKISSDAIQYGQDQYDILKKADALLVLTEWDQFRNPDFNKMKKLMRKFIIIGGEKLCG